MASNTQHLARCIQTLESSLTLYSAATEDSVEQEVYRNAIVKGFELTQETAFKLLRRALREFGHGVKKLDATSVKDLLRLAAIHSLLAVDAVERWFDYRDNRNDTAHDYGVGFAHETLELLPAFLDNVRALEATLRAHFEKSA